MNSNVNTATLEGTQTVKKATLIFISGDVLCFDPNSVSPDAQDSRLATAEEFNQGDRCVGSIFEALDPGELIELIDGQFILGHDLELVFKFAGYSENGEEQWEDLASGEVKSSWVLRFY